MNASSPLKRGIRRVKSTIMADDVVVLDIALSRCSNLQLEQKITDMIILWSEQEQPDEKDMGDVP